MSFKPYDILATLIPGVLVLAIMLDLMDVEWSNDYILPATALSFVVGYFVNAISSWIEPVLFWTWGGRPNEKILSGKGIGRAKVSEWEKIKTSLKEEGGEGMNSNYDLFEIAKRRVNGSANLRIQTFNQNYAFSRVMLVTVILGSGFLIWSYSDWWPIYPITVSLIGIAWVRGKQRAYYYCKEVLNTYLTQTEER